MRAASSASDLSPRDIPPRPRTDHLVLVAAGDARRLAFDHQIEDHRRIALVAFFVL
jgi:hypothetical protein